MRGTQGALQGPGSSLPPAGYSLWAGRQQERNGSTTRAAAAQDSAETQAGEQPDICCVLEGTELTN